MKYKYCNNMNFEDLACGRVIYHKAGFPNFPVRLTQEIFGRCLSYLEKEKEVSVYDPCCGSAYLLTVLGFYNMDTIASIIASDISMEAVEVAKQNLLLLSQKGLENRINILENEYSKYQKKSHFEAIESAKRLQKQLKLSCQCPSSKIFQKNIMLKNKSLIPNFKVDIVITDVPYGGLVEWQELETDGCNILLDNLIPFLNDKSVVAICSDKKQKFCSDKYIRLEKQFIGKRKFEIFTLRKE